MARLTDFLAELRRRRVIRALVFWGIASFAVLQVYEPVMHGLHLPEWTLSFVVVVLGLGFPIAAGLAWVFDLKATGIERTAPVVAEGAAAPSGAPWRRLRLALLLLGLGAAAAAPGLVYFFAWPGAGRHQAAGPEAGPAAPSIAVLPFADMSAQRDQEYFSDGIAEEILNALAQVPGLRVAGRTSSFAFKGRNEDLSSIAQKLKVGALLEGSVRKEGNRVRVTAQLVNAADGFHVWSETFDREVTGIFAVQDEIARAVTRALQVKLLPGQRPARAGAQTRDPEAYRLYLLGRQLLPLGTEAGFRGGVEALQRSVQLDPGYAPAQAWLAFGIWWQAVMGTGDMTAPNARALAGVEKAIAIAPELADGYAIRGSLRGFTTWDWEGARSDYERALALAPGDVTTLANYALLLAALGRLPEALRLAQQASEADPLSPVATRWLGVFQSASGHPELAEATFRRGLEAAPGNAYLLRELGFAYLVEGKAREALELFEHHPVEWMKNLGLALAQHQLGHPAESRRSLDALIAMGSVAASYQIAQVHAWRGEKDQAFRWLEQGYATNDSGMRFLKFDPFVRGLRPDPRYGQLLRKMNLPLD